MTSLAGAETLRHRRVLVAEDEYLLADDMARALRQLGAGVVGPVPTRPKAMALLLSDARIDAAVLDINLRGETVFPVADVLTERGVPFVFATGYEPPAVPPAYHAVPRWEKPFDVQDLARALPARLRR